MGWNSVTACLLVVIFFSVHAKFTLDAFTTTESLHENTTGQTELALVECKADGNLKCICTHRETSPPSGSGLFDVWQGVAGGFKVYFVGGSLDYRTVGFYNVTVVCRDNEYKDPEQTAVLVVSIRPNQSPQVDGYPSVTLNAIDVQTPPYKPAGTLIYEVKVTDAENDAITYTMTQNPDLGAFTIGAGDGIIRAAIDLRQVAIDTIVCYVTVADARNTLPPFAVTVKLTNLKKRPVISNLPATINVTEGATTGRRLITLTVSDEDVTSYCSVEPNAEADKFTYYPSQKELWLDAPSDGQTLLDYETTNKYLITCTAYDGFLYSEGDVLTLYVDNVNEPPVFDQPLYFCTMYEPRAGLISSCDPAITVTDPEQNTIVTMALLPGNNSERFRYDRVSNRLTFSGDYDVDNNNMPTTATITIYAVDSHRATGSAEIQVNVLDANDNTCLDGESAVKQYSISQFTPVKTLGYFRAEDDDLTSPNNKLTYQVISALPSSAVNYISVFGNGQIKYISLIPESEDGKSYTLVVRCRDGGSPSLSATGTVQVSYVKTVTPTVATTTAITPTGTTTTTETPNSGGDDDDVWDDSFVALFVVLMVLLAIVVAAAVWFLCTRYNLGCVRKASYDPQSRVTPVREYRNPRDDFARSPGPPESPYYRDAGGRYDNGYYQRPITKSDVFMTGMHNQRALPPPGLY